MLFSLGSRGPAAWHMSRSQAYWYHVAQYVADLEGLFLYAYGIVSLARRTRREDFLLATFIAILVATGGSSSPETWVFIGVVDIPMNLLFSPVLDHLPRFELWPR